MRVTGNITGVLLAGGKGSRMGGADKGWIEFEGMALVERLLPQLARQVDKVIISANRNVERYAALGAPAVADLRSDYAGPLAAIAAALERVHDRMAADLPGGYADRAAGLCFSHACNGTFRRMACRQDRTGVHAHPAHIAFKRPEDFLGFGRTPGWAVGTATGFIACCFR